jgi:hypothetical protein
VSHPRIFGVAQNLTSELHSEIASLSSLLHTRSSSSISSFERRGAAIRRVFAAVRRQRTAQSAALVAASDESSALLDAKQSAKSSNPSAKIGFRLAIRMLLALIKNAAKADGSLPFCCALSNGLQFHSPSPDHSILDEILEEASILVSELPVLSLCSSEFDSSVFLSSGDINEALKPAIQYMHQILTYDWSTDRHRAWALQILLAMSLARGSLVDTLALVQKLCASTLQLDVGTLLQTLQTLPVYDRNAPHHSTAHPHPLTLCPLNGPLSSKSGWNCDGRVGDTHACARDNVVRGRPRYRCSECDFDLCDLCYQATRKSMDVAPAPSYPEFPYSVQQCVEVFATQSSDLIEAPVAALFILAHLERLASPFAPLADALTSQKSDDAPKLSHPLSLEVSAKTFEQLHDLLAALVDAPSRIQSRGILAVLKILFSHIQVASDANARFDFGKTDSLLTLLLRLTDAAWTTSNSDLDIVMKVNICAARIITAGFRYFYPTASQQLQFLLVLFRSERPLLPHELQILRSVKSTFTRFGGSIVDELQMGPVMNECHPSIAALIELGLNQSLSLLAGKESNSSDFGPVDLLKSFQLHLMARLHSALLPTPGDSVPDNVRWTLLSLLCSYARAIVGTARQLIDACHQHINVLQETKLSGIVVLKLNVEKCVISSHCVFGRS